MFHTLRGSFESKERQMGNEFCTRALALAVVVIFYAGGTITAL